MNSPESLLRLHGLVARLDSSKGVYAAELIREIGVKCIGFNGVCIRYACACIDDSLSDARSLAASTVSMRSMQDYRQM